MFACASSAVYLKDLASISSTPREGEMKMGKSTENFFRLVPTNRMKRPVTGAEWHPPADVYRTADGWIVKVELAGVRPDELEITIRDSILRISGSRRDTMCRQNILCHQLEITYSRFEKTLRFPCSIEGAEIERDYRDGLLILNLRCG
jgi:HSP20 family protein